MSEQAMTVPDSLPISQPDATSSASAEPSNPHTEAYPTTSRPSDASNGAPPGRMTNGAASSPPATADDPWRPIVLSLDGGGIRGLSSLFIIREIMREIQKLENPNGDPGGKLPLPCHYFDFMFGTSTGGLIAIMLSRLRMDIDDCIREYHVFGNSIFRPQMRKPFRYMSKRFQYSPEKFKSAVEEVVSKYCGCINGEKAKCKNHYLRQDDFAEEGDVVSRSKVNKTCKAAVITLREGGGNSDGVDAADVTYLFRTYNHRYRGGPFEEELNPKILDKSTLTIVEACRATSAAPTWFPPVKLRGRKFIDGGVTEHNNPAVLAWHEANEMSHKPGDTKDLRGTKGPQVLLSVGTGKTKQPRRFGLYNLMLSGRHKLTDTEDTHKQLVRFISAEECLYRRFNVPESNSSQEEKGLDMVKLDACKKERRKTVLKKPGMSDATNTDSFEDAAPEKGKEGYKPHKYRYKIYEKIRQRTENYCRKVSTVANDNIPGEIVMCATKLFELSQRRKLDSARWKEFQEHPNPRSRLAPNLQTHNSMGIAILADSQPNS